MEKGIDLSGIGRELYTLCLQKLASSKYLTQNGSHLYMQRNQDEEEKGGYRFLGKMFAMFATLLNERPIGYMPSQDNVINILTRNQLLLGRSTPPSQ